MPSFVNGRLVFHYIHPVLNLSDDVHDKFVSYWDRGYFLVQTNQSELNTKLKNMYRRIEKNMIKLEKNKNKLPVNISYTGFKLNEKILKLSLLFTKYIEWVQYAVVNSYETGQSNQIGWKCPYCKIRKIKSSKQPIIWFKPKIFGQLQKLGQPQCSDGFVGAEITNHGAGELMLQAIQYYHQEYVQSLLNQKSK